MRARWHRFRTAWWCGRNSSPDPRPRRAPRWRAQRAASAATLLGAFTHDLHDAAALLPDRIACVELERSVAAQDLPVGAAHERAAHRRSFEGAASDVDHAALAQR